jgi:cytoplasmic iron level regulating protein YaaA (DUF328/UPF0246 family)
MYVSELFKKSLAYAKSLNPDRIFILSAKYKVLELTDIIEPYELALNDMSERERKLWAYHVIKQLELKDIDFTEKAVFLCSEKYRKYIKLKFPNYSIPLQHMGIGEQLKFYKERLRQTNEKNHV